MKKLNIFVFFISIMTSVHATQNETDIIHNFFLANYEQSKGKLADLQKAQQGYQRLLLCVDAPIHVYKGYLPLLAALKDYKQIVVLIPQLQDRFANDPDIQLLFGQALESSGKQKEADQLYIKLSRQFKTHQEIVYQAVNSYRRNQERGNAIQLIDDMLNNSSRKPNNFIFHFMKAQLFTELNDPANARTCVGKSLELYPHFDKGWLLFGMLEENAGKLDDAIKGYTNFLELSGTSNAQLEKHLLELLMKRHMLETKQNAMAVDNKCLLEGLALFQQKEYRKGMHAINKCLEKQPDNKDATIIKINMLGVMGKRRQAIRLLNAFLLQNPDSEIAYTQLHALCLDGLSLPKALTLLHDIAYMHPNSPLVHLHIAELYEKKGMLIETIFHYQRALEYIHDTDLETRIMYNLACLYAESKNYDRMKSLLAIIMKKSPHFMPAFHLLAYHYLTYEEDVTRAQELLNVVLKNDPANTYYRITQARLLHETGHSARALKLLNKARIYASNQELIDLQSYDIADQYLETHLPKTHTL